METIRRDVQTRVKVHYQLRNRGVLGYLMEHPGRGAPYSIRGLADAAGVPRATLGHLLTGRADGLDMLAAHAVAEALGVAVLVLFAPPVSPHPTNLTQSKDELREEETDGAHAT